MSAKISSVPLATESERQRNSNPRKFYPADPGLIRAFDTSGQSNVGRALETVVANELARRAMDIGYVKTLSGREVDFLVRNPAGGIEMVQVCADLGNADTLARELQALSDAREEYPDAACRLIVLNSDGVADVKAPGVTVQPAYEWLLQASTIP